MFRNQPYSRPFEGSHNEVPRRNPNYKGKNYDPNYQGNQRSNTGKKRNNNKNHFSGVPRRVPKINPHLQSHQIQLQAPIQQQFIPHEQLQQQYYEPQPEVTPPDNLAVYLMQNLAQTVDERCRRDGDGDTRICGCIADGTQCFHDVVDSYEDLLVDCGMLQHGIVDLFSFLMSNNGVLNEFIKAGLLEYLQNNPETPLSTIIGLISQF
ncbi:hypothetical protein F5Y07DRAFT_403031 [Xylaria sp. FL0933]|nr:hypothetical protein F5Y07DRAFT_403031 [Xylaria sp. FL0933]